MCYTETINYKSKKSIKAYYNHLLKILETNYDNVDNMHVIFAELNYIKGLAIKYHGKEWSNKYLNLSSYLIDLRENVYYMKGIEFKRWN